MKLYRYNNMIGDLVILAGVVSLIFACPAKIIAEENITEKPTCAIFPIEALYGMEEDQTDLITGSFIQAVSILNRLQPVDSLAVDNAIDAHTLAKLPLEERAFRLGQLLNVSKSISGTLEHTKGIYIVHTMLVDINTGEIDGEITSYSDADFNQMLAQIPYENASQLMMKLKPGKQRKLSVEEGKSRITEKSPWKLDVWSGVGYWSGDVTYRIGNTVKLPDGSEFNYWFPLSELEWPLNVVMASVGGDVTYMETIEARGVFSISVNDPTDKMEDSDWEYPGIKTIYSESDAELSAWSVDAGIRWWFLGNQKKNFTWGLGTHGFSNSHGHFINSICYC